VIARVARFNVQKNLRATCATRLARESLGGDSFNFDRFNTRAWRLRVSGGKLFCRRQMRHITRSRDVAFRVDECHSSLQEYFWRRARRL